MRIEWSSWNALEETALNINQDEESVFSESEAQPLTLYDAGIDTHFGRFSSDSPMRPSERWNCWLGHTDFKLTEKHVESIDNTNGVAAFRVIDPYTFCIGIPKSFFKESDVKQRIQAKICKRKSGKTNS